MDVNKTPDYLEPLIGWRRWRVSGDGHLHAVSMIAQWKPYEAIASKHEDGGWGFKQGPPDEPCRCPSCGIYANKTADQVKSGLDKPWPWTGGYNPCVVGRVALWGRVVIHERGYRAQYAYPLEFVYAHSCDGAAIARMYGVPFNEDPSWTSAFQSELSSSNHWSFQSPYMSLSPSWSSRYLCQPDEHKFIIEPEPPKVDATIPKWLRDIKIEAPKVYQRPSGIWVRGTDEFEALDHDYHYGGFTPRYYYCGTDQIESV